MEQNFIFILCNPEESRNIGSSCRALKAMGLNDLRIVGKKSDYDENQVKTLALHAFDVWEQSSFYDCLQEALADCSLAAGTTRRKGKKRTDGLLAPRSFMETVTARPSRGKIALVFGNERTGLTDAELDCCQLGVTIPSHPSFGSLNLSHAVQILAYEIFLASQAHTHCAAADSAPLEQIDSTVRNILRALTGAGFFKIGGREEMELFWKGIFARAGLDTEEARYISRIFDKADALISKKI